MICLCTCMQSLTFPSLFYTVLTHFLILFELGVLPKTIFDLDSATKPQLCLSVFLKEDCLVRPPDPLVAAAALLTNLQGKLKRRHFQPASITYYKYACCTKCMK